VATVANVPGTITINGMPVADEIIMVALEAMRSRKLVHMDRAKKAKTAGSSLSELRKAETINEAVSVIAYVTGLEPKMKPDERRLAGFDPRPRR
jgi:pantoate kinase